MIDKELLLKKIENEINNCTKCRLCKTATQAVVGEGNINTKVVFIGEAPGEKEDITGRPFIGRAGQLLDKMLGKIELKREDVWIGNIIKHRPPENRDPLPDEISACEGFLTLQIKAIAPLLIVTLGRFSMNYFLPDAKISHDKGRIISVRGFNVYPVYHPAAALRSPSMMREFVQDFVRIPQVISELDKK